MTDLMTRLVDARPTDADLDALWPPAERDARLTTILTARRRRRVRRLALPAVAATVAAVAVVPSLVDSDDAAAATDLHALARAAVSYDQSALQPGQWLHEKSSSVQHNAPGVDGGATWVHTRETWTNGDGTVLLVDRETGDPVEYDRLDRQGPASYQDPTTAFSATLPSDQHGLLAYLAARVSGSSSHAEAMYEALTQLASSHTLPPQTLAAAFDALATVDHVTTSHLDVAGRPAIEVSYDEELTSSTEAYVFDRETGQELSSGDDSLQGDFASTLGVSEIVDQVPPAVLAHFRTRR